jgi:fluoride exporter
MIQSSECRTIAAISLGAIAGALSRYYLGIWISQYWASPFPYSTFLINVSGCFGMGLIMTLVAAWGTPFSSELRLMLAVGFLGSYTTFSTYGLETLNLVRTGRPEMALIYAFSSVLLGVIGVQCGVWVAKFLLFLGRA